MKQKPNESLLTRQQRLLVDHLSIKPPHDHEEQRAETKRQVDGIMNMREVAGDKRFFEGWAEKQNISDLHTDIMMAVWRIMDLTQKSGKSLKEILKRPLEILNQTEYLPFDKKEQDWPEAETVDRKNIEFGSVFGRMLSHHPEFVNLMKYAYFNRLRSEPNRKNWTTEERKLDRKIKSKDQYSQKEYKNMNHLADYGVIDHNSLTGEDFLAAARYFYNKNIRTLISTDFMRGKADDINPSKNQNSEENKKKYQEHLKMSIEFNRMLGARWVNDFDQKGEDHSPLPGPGESIGLFALERGDLLINSVKDIDELNRMGIKLFASQYGTANMMIELNPVTSFEYGEEIGKVVNEKGFPDGKLTDLGVQCTVRALELGMVIDLAHMWKTPRDQVIEIAKRMDRKGQVIYSHGGIAEYTYKHADGTNAGFTYKRSATLEQAEKILELDGYVGLVPLIPHIGLTNLDDKEVVEKLVNDFCDDVVKLIGKGMGDKIFLAMDYLGTERVSVPPQFGNYNQLRATLKQKLTEKGISPKQIEKFLWKNGQDFVLHTFVSDPKLPKYPVSIKPINKR